jgi:sugar phosphate isomerase/epimerase
MSNNYPKLHNAMWPGLVGKEEGTDHPPISLERMLELTAAAEVDGQKFEGVDYFLFFPHTDPDASDDELKRIADLIAGYGLKVGTLVAPVWPGTVGASAMGSAEDREKFVLAVRKACRIAKVFNEHGVRQYGNIRIDSATGVEDGTKDPAGNTKKIAETFREAAKVAADHGERLAAEGEICWGGMHSWKHMLNLLEEVDMPETVGFQADQAHTYLYLLGYNAEEHALLKPGYSRRVRRRLQDDDRRAAAVDHRLPRRPERRHGPRRPVRTTRRAGTARPTIPTASWTSPRPPATGCKAPPSARHAAHLLGRLHVPQRRSWRRRKPGTRSCAR